MRITFLITLAFSLLTLVHCSKDKESKFENEPKIYPSLLTKEQDWKFGQQAYEHADKIVAFGPRPAESKELEQTRQYIQEQLNKRGWLVKRQDFVAQTPEGKKQFVNLYARYQAKGQSPQEVWGREHKGVLGAHIDTKKIPGLNYLGAIDAAGSVGAVIEVGDFLARTHPDKAKLLELVFFDGEEAIEENISYGAGYRDGLYGSHYYALHRNQKRNFGIVLDLLGHKNQKVDIPPVSNSPGDTPARMVEVFLAAAKKHGVEKDFTVKKSGGVIDDHLPLAMFGTPSVDIIGAFSEEDDWWHDKGDVMENLSADKLGISIKIALEVLASELER